MSAKESKYIPLILAKLATPEQARVIRELPAPPEEIARRLHMDKALVEKHLKEMMEKGLVVITKHGARMVRNTLQLHDSATNNPKYGKLLGEEYLDLWAAYQLEEHYPALIDTLIGADRRFAYSRILPRWKSIQDVPGVLPCEDIREIMKSQEVIALVPCPCKKAFQKRPCGVRDETCINVGRTALYNLNRGGGQGAYLYFLSRELAQMGHEVTILVGNPEPWPMPWARKIRIENLNLWGVRRNFLPPSRPWTIFRPFNFYEFAATRFGFLPEMLIFSLRAFPYLRRLVSDRDVDVIHDVQNLGYGLLLWKRLSRPVVTTVHHPLTMDYQASAERDRTFKERYYTVVFCPLGMQRRVIRKCDRVFTSSQESAREIARSFRVRPEKIRNVFNGLDAEFLRPLNGASRTANTLLFVGNTDDTKKGIVHLLQAMTLLPEAITLTIVDEGKPYKTYAPGLVEKWGLSSRVIFTGKLSTETLHALYQRSELVALPSPPFMRVLGCRPPKPWSVNCPSSPARPEPCRKSSATMAPPSRFLPGMRERSRRRS